MSCSTDRTYTLAEVQAYLRKAHDRGKAAGEAAVLHGLRTVSALNGSGLRVLKTIHDAAGHDHGEADGRFVGGGGGDGGGSEEESPRQQLAPIQSHIPDRDGEVSIRSGGTGKVNSFAYTVNPTKAELAALLESGVAVRGWADNDKIMVWAGELTHAGMRRSFADRTGGANFMMDRQGDKFRLAPYLLRGEEGKPSAWPEDWPKDHPYFKKLGAKIQPSGFYTMPTGTADSSRKALAWPDDDEYWEDDPEIVSKSAAYVESEHPRDKHGAWMAKGDIDAAGREAREGNHDAANKLREQVAPEHAHLLEQHLAYHHITPEARSLSHAAQLAGHRRRGGEEYGQHVNDWLKAVTAAIRHGADYDHGDIQRGIERATAGQTTKLRRVLRVLDPETLVSHQPTTKEGLQRRIREIISTAVHAAKDIRSHVVRNEAEQREKELHEHAVAHALKLRDAVGHLQRMEGWQRGDPASAQPGDAVHAARERIAALLGHEEGAAVKAFVTKAAHRFASTQILLPGDLSAVLLDFAAQIPDGDLGEDGRESEPHVTVRWGLHGDDAGAVREKLTGLGPVRYRLGKVTVFKGEGKPYDVVKVDVESPDLHALNSVLGELPHTDTFPDYHPHATIAYVKAGLGEKYAAKFGDVNRDGVADAVIYSDTEKNRSVVPLSLAAA